VRVFLLITIGCQAPAPLQPPPSAVLPTAPGEHAPSLVRFAGTYDPQVHQDTKGCGNCHSEHARQWQRSMHALSSFNNPLYRVSFEDFVQANPGKGNFCGGCHDPTLLFGGALDRPVRAEDARAHLGVTCATCHGIVEAKPEGVASYVLATTAIPLPKPGDSDSLRAHKERVRIRTDALCHSCHRGFLSQDTGHAAFIPALDEVGPWQRSGYGQQSVTISDRLQPQTCVDCHMPRMQSPGDGATSHMHSHEFLGGHWTMAHAIGDPELLVRQKALVAEVAWLGIVDGTDVVVANLGVGHAFPGGAKDLRDMWLQVEAFDASGARIGSDASHRFHAQVVDAQGQIVQDHAVDHIYAPAYNTTLRPKGAALVRYHVGDAARVEARLLARRVSLPFQRAACGRAQTPAGQAFLDETKRRTGLRPDVCAEQPVVELAHATWPEQLTWRHWYWHGIAQETRPLEEQRIDSFDKALALLPPGNERDALSIRGARADMLVRLGRREDAAAALATLPDLPAVHRMRGDLAAAGWDAAGAARHYLRAAEGAPKNDMLLAQLSQWQGSAEQPARSLQSAQQGLHVNPRNPALLRSQMLALGQLGDDAAARAAFFAHKPDERAPEVRRLCQTESCNQERNPGHIHALRRTP
jgi:hypothetical protein